MLADLIERRIKRVQVTEDIYARVGKRLHAFIVIGSRINMIDSYSVCTKICHLLCVKLALISICERVLVCKLVRNACRLVNG